MKSFDSGPENKERGPKCILAIESNNEVNELYKTWFREKMNLPVEVASPGNALIKPRKNVGIIIVEPPKNDNIGNYILKLRDIYPNQQIVVASQRDDILSDIKDPKRFPNVSAITKPFHLEELTELIKDLQSGEWKGPLSRVEH